MAFPYQCGASRFGEHPGALDRVAGPSSPRDLTAEAEAVMEGSPGAM